MTHRLLFLVTADWYFCSHRLPLALAARDAGFAVTVVTQVDAHGDVIRDHGLDLVPVRFPRSARHPLADLRLLASLPRIYARVRPHVAHHVALKPVLYGAAAAALARVPVTVNAVAGLGYAFIADGGRARGWQGLLSRPLRAALRRRRAWTLLQNPDDARTLAAAGLIDPRRLYVVRGSGVDLERFEARAEPGGTPMVLLAARMLWDKGVGEFVEAARMLRGRGVRCRFVLAGDTDRDNPAAVAPERLRQWRDEGVIEWSGHRPDMPALLAEASVACLPSYREGLPKSLLEAAAAGRAMVATDVPGCREVVEDGVTGLLVPARDARALADALQALLADAPRRRAMGAAARRLAEREFAVERVVRDTLAIYRELLGEPSGELQARG